LVDDDDDHVTGMWMRMRTVRLRVVLR